MNTSWLLGLFLAVFAVGVFFVHLIWHRPYPPAPETDLHDWDEEDPMQRKFWPELIWQPDEQETMPAVLSRPEWRHADVGDARMAANGRLRDAA